jgi:NADPH2:quinone reductase
MRAAVFERFGEPTEVLEIREVPDPEPGPGEVRVRMIASPVNPSDLLVVRGRYGALPELPAIPGFEGVGIVEKAGPGLLGQMVLGKRVVAINARGGNWAELAVIPARQARPLPDDIDDEQAAAFFVNPATVLAMVRHVLGVRRGDWLLQSAAGSTLGKMVIKLGRYDGFRTVNVVRRVEAKDELTRLGADAVISSEGGNLEERIREATGGQEIRHAIDAVGGETGTNLLRALGTGGRLLVYGTLSGEPILAEPRVLIAGRRVVEGFWLGHWMRDRTIPEVLWLFRRIASLIRLGVLSSEIGATFPLREIKAAVAEAERVGRSGKVLIRLE